MLSETSSVQHASGQTAVRTERAIIPGMQTLWHADALACRRFGMRTPWDADARAVLNYATLPFKIRSPARFLRKGEPTTNGVFIEAMTCNYRHEEPLELLFRPIPLAQYLGVTFPALRSVSFLTFYCSLLHQRWVDRPSFRTPLLQQFRQLSFLLSSLQLSVLIFLLAEC